MTDSDDALPPGTVFGSYRIERGLGEGGVGAVYLATHVGLQKPVVLKVLHPQYARSANLRSRFAREGRAAAAIRHPHVVDVTDVGEHRGTPYLIMEYLQGESLGDLIARVGALPPDRAVDLLLPVIAAVEAAHGAGVIHRDLKPDNLLITRGATGEPFPKVLDFGISRVLSGDGGQRTGTAAMLGTPAYMAPEQIASTRDADARSDQYALGVILYECVTGRRAFSGENVYAILKLVGDGQFHPPRAVRPDLSIAFEQIVLRAMSRDPSGRFPSLRAMAAALLPFASQRVRSTWGATFSPGAEHGHADTRITVSGATSHESNAHPDTLAEAVHTQDSNAVPVTRRSRARVAALFVAALLLIATTVSVVSLRSGNTPSNMAGEAHAPPHVAAVTTPVAPAPVAVVPQTLTQPSVAPTAPAGAPTPTLTARQQPPAAQSPDTAARRRVSSRRAPRGAAAPMISPSGARPTAPDYDVAP